MSIQLKTRGDGAFRILVLNGNLEVLQHIYEWQPWALSNDDN